MKRPSLRFALPFVALLGVTLAFNSCQGGLLGKGFSANLASHCKVGLEKGVLTKLNFDDKRPPKPFLAGKVRLRDDTTVTDPVNIPTGTPLSVIIDNSCLLRGGLDATLISRAAAESGHLSPELDRQAYLWETDQEYTEARIQEMADGEACVLGVSWNKKYRFQTMAFSDTGYSSQTHLPAIHAAEAYDSFYGSKGMGVSGTPVVIAVVDTGVDTNHPDVSPNLWRHSQGIGVDITTLDSGSVSYDPSDISDIGHGTHVSGLIGAVASNGMGTIGAMPYRAQVMPIRVFKREASGDLSTTSQYFYNALKFAYLNGASVVNLSLGSVASGPASDPVAESGIDEAIQHGVVVVTVIGNADSGNGVNIDGNTMSSIPGQFAVKSGVLGVGSFDITTGAKSYFSHYSTVFTEIGAPGAEAGDTGIYSTVPVTLGSYGRLAGTSQASPLVAAAAGLTVGLIREFYGTPPTPAEVERLLLASAIKSPQLTGYFKDGNRLDLRSLVQKINADYPKTLTGVRATATSSNCP